MVKKFLLLGVSVLAFNCSTDKCKDVTCQNTSKCVDGTCQCPTGYSGTNCEKADVKLLICNNASKTWKMLSGEIDGVNTPLTSEDIARRYVFNVNGTWTQSSKTSTFKWSYDSITDVLTFEDEKLLSYSVANNQFMYKGSTKIGGKTVVITVVLVPV